MNFKKPCSCPRRWKGVPCCCKLPALGLEHSGQSAMEAMSNYMCHCPCWIPKFEYVEHGQPVYIVQPETCCFGLCIPIDMKTCRGCLYHSFFFHDPKDMS